MLNSLFEFSLRNRFLVLVFVGLIIAAGVYAMRKLPIDAVPDVTPNQVQILTDSNKDESPSFAPNSRMILIATEIGGRGVLSAVSSDGRIKQRLSVAAGDVREPAWGPFSK